MGYETFTDVELLALCVWREARGEIWDAKLGVACSVRNRVQHPKWWGHDYHSVILERYQYSSFNDNDPNSTKYPDLTDAVYLECVEAASLVINGNCPDTVAGAQYYYDKSLDGNPPKWAENYIHTCDLGRLHFFKEQ